MQTSELDGEGKRTGLCQNSTQISQNSTQITVTDSSSDLVLASGTNGTYYKLGAPKTLTIKNTGSSIAENVRADISALVSSEVSVSSCPTILAPNEECTLTFTPGKAISKKEFTISGSNTNTLTGSLTILDYGSAYQGGLVYALVPHVFGTTADPSDACDYTGGTTSQGLDNCSKIAAVSDNSTGVTWTAGFSTTSATDKYNGMQNTSRILSDSECTSGNCAADVCKEYSVNEFNNWYLPAICEMGYYSLSLAGCNSGTQNMNTSLTLNSFGDFDTIDLYWSSTENNSSNAWDQVFGVSGSQNFDPKLNQFRVRCSRLITP